MGTGLPHNHQVSIHQYRYVAVVSVDAAPSLLSVRVLRVIEPLVPQQLFSSFGQYELRCNVISFLLRPSYLIL